MLRRRLVLGVLVTAPRDWKKLRDAIVRDRRRRSTCPWRSTAARATTGPARSGRSHVTLIGAPLKASAMAAMAGRIADLGANIDRIERMARYPVTAIELHVSGVDPDRLRASLVEEATRQGVDVAVQPANLLRRGMRLIVMDVDSTLVQGEVIEMLAAHAGCADEVARVTEEAMRGEHRLRGVAAGAGRAARGRGGVGARRGLRRDRVRPRRAHHGPDPQAARLPVRDGLRRLHPDHRPDRRGPRLRLRPGQRARDRRRQADRPDRRRRRRPGRQGRGAARVRRRGRRRRQRGDRHRRRRQRPRHAQRRRHRHRLQRQAGRPAGRADRR